MGPLRPGLHVRLGEHRGPKSAGLLGGRQWAVRGAIGSKTRRNWLGTPFLAVSVPAFRRYYSLFVV